ncbi:MAG: hypothetical protein IBJ00_07905, partial [Alphaproteobacteria bacterium]|nr:hypothetical protein [Alphaproteobacteria bacterium]
MKNKFIYLSALLVISTILIYPTCASFDASGTSYLPVKKSKQEVLDQAIADCQQFIDFEEQFLDFARKMNMEKPDSIMDLQAIECNIESQRQVKRLLESFNAKSFDAENLLVKLLDLRFDFLDTRREIMISVREEVRKVLSSSDAFRTKKKRPIYGPTRPKAFEALSPYGQFLARSSTDRYQFLNKLIITLWQLIDPRSLRAQTKLKVRCSTTLWANLTGERDYLGHPDEAILIYDDEPFPFNKDWINYDCYLREWPTKIELLGWGKGKSIEIFRTPYDRSLMDPDFEHYGKIDEAPYPDWLKPLPQNFLKGETPSLLSKSGTEKPAVQNKKKPKKSSKVKNKRKQKKSSKARKTPKSCDIYQERQPLPKPEAEKISLTKTDLPGPLTHLEDAEVLVIPE